MQDDRTLFDEPHHRSLELLTVRALAAGDAAKAFEYADRRCRISPSPGPHSHVLRGEALFQMGDRPRAVAALAEALELAPLDIAANRRMLAWAKGSQRSKAAVNLIRSELDQVILRDAITILRADRGQHFANAIVYDDAISGWAVWLGQTALEITIASEVGARVTLVEPDPSHAFADLGRAANFDLPRPKSSVPQSIMISVGDEVIYTSRLPANETRPGKVRKPKHNEYPVKSRSVAVVVPIFADFDSVQMCLESLLRALDASGDHRVILVNDATPDRRIAEYLEVFAKNPGVLLLKNPRNLGFVGSVNRALARLGDEDVVLLNADTLVPKNFVARLAAVAASAANIGTVTPLSNNGEDASFPVANKSNPLGTKDDVSAIDAIAATVNAGRIIDIPVGTGFCLFITRECLDAVGLLSEDFYRGYVEDVDFCLRARAKGFRNICAPSIYVGHAGNKSFGQEKRALVVRNYAVLDRRFPSYRAETAAFDFANPLAPSRQAIERAMPALAMGPRWLLTGSGIMAALAGERARQIASERPSQRSSTMILQVHYEATGPKAKIFNPGGGIPQSLQFDLALASESHAMVDYVRATNPSAIEIIDPAHLPLAVVDGLLKLDVPHDMFIGDAALATDGEIRAPAIPRLNASMGAAAALTDTALRNDNEARATAKRWREITATARRILVPSEQARAFALSRLDKSAFLRAAVVPPREETQRRRRRSRTISRLGLLSIRANGEEQRLIGGMAAALRSSSTAAITVIGATLDDLSLMHIGNVFVTGAVDRPDFNGVVKSYGLQALFLAATRPIFGHPIVELAFACGLPVGFFDWSGGRFKPRKGDLVLDPATPFDDVMTLLGRWMAKP